MASLAQTGEVCQKLPAEALIGFVVDLQILPGPTRLALFTVRRPITLTHELPLGAPYVAGVLFRKFEGHNKLMIAERATRCPGGPRR
jgi:hypothetical protein